MNLLFCKGCFPRRRLEGCNCYCGDWGITHTHISTHTNIHIYPHPPLISVKGSYKFKSEDQSNWVDSAVNGSMWLTSLGWFNIQAWHEVCLSYFKMLWLALGYPEILTLCQIDLTPWGRGWSSDSHTLLIGCPNAIIFLKNLYWQRKMNIFLLEKHTGHCSSSAVWLIWTKLSVYCIY